MQIKINLISSPFPLKFAPLGRSLWDDLYIHWGHKVKGQKKYKEIFFFCSISWYRLCWQKSTSINTGTDHSAEKREDDLNWFSWTAHRKCPLNTLEPFTGLTSNFLQWSPLGYIVRARPLKTSVTFFVFSVLLPFHFLNGHRESKFFPDILSTNIL